MCAKQNWPLALLVRVKAAQSPGRSAAHVQVYTHALWAQQSHIPKRGEVVPEKTYKNVYSAFTLCVCARINTYMWRSRGIADIFLY